MTRYAYVNGRYLPYARAAVAVDDRGFQFADAVYEVCEVVGGRLIDEERHVNRLLRSLGELAIPPPMSRGALARVMRETVRRNRVRDGSVYLQVTRGAAPRDFLFPDPARVEPTLVCLARHASLAAIEARAASGIWVVTARDHRWARSDIKTVMLLPSVLAKEGARARGAKEAWLVDDEGFVTEGASSNAWIVTRDGALVTRPADHRILRGVTRTTLIDVLDQLGVALVERPFSVAEALEAREAFITSASNTVMPVVRIDDRVIGNGSPGSLTLTLREHFRRVATRSAP